MYVGGNFTGVKQARTVPREPRRAVGSTSPATGQVKWRTKTNQDSLCLVAHV